MKFLIIGILALVILGIIAALFSSGEDDEIVRAEGCAGCEGKKDCKLACLMEEKRTANHHDEA